jgi:hypothetical protein
MAVKTTTKSPEREREREFHKTGLGFTFLLGYVLNFTLFMKIFFCNFEFHNSFVCILRGRVVDPGTIYAISVKLLVIFFFIEFLFTHFC